MRERVLSNLVAYTFGIIIGGLFSIKFGVPGLLSGLTGAVLVMLVLALVLKDEGSWSDYEE